MHEDAYAAYIFLGLELFREQVVPFITFPLKITYENYQRIPRSFLVFPTKFVTVTFMSAATSNDRI